MIPLVRIPGVSLLPLTLAVALILVSRPSAQAAGDNTWKIVAEDNLTSAPIVAEMNSPYLAVAKSGRLVAAWAGGAKAGYEDFSIWVSRQEDSGWQTARLVADGRQPDGTLLPCWQPTLSLNKTGDLLLSFKVGPTADAALPRILVSTDEGLTWTPAPPATLAANASSSGLNNHTVPLSQGGFLQGQAVANPDIPPHRNQTPPIEGGCPLVVSTSSDGQTWTQVLTLEDKPTRYGYSDPAVVQTSDGTIHMLYVWNLWRIKHVALRANSPQ